MRRNWIENKTVPPPKSQDSTVIHSRKFPLPRRASYGVGCGSVSYCIQASILYLIETIWIHRITHIWKAQLTDGDNKNSYLLNQCCHKLNKEDVEWFSAKHFDCISFNIWQMLWNVNILWIYMTHISWNQRSKCVFDVHRSNSYFGISVIDRKIYRWNLAISVPFDIWKTR